MKKGSINDSIYLYQIELFGVLIVFFATDFLDPLTPDITIINHT